MRFLKASTLSKKNIKNDDVAVDINGQVILGTKNSVLVPKGNNSTDRPASPVNGHLRYNTTDNELEAYQNGAWRNIRFKEFTSITKITLGTGDDVETTFGPFNSSYVPNSADGIIVLVENVMQISTTNFTLVQNPSSGPNSPYAAGWYLVFSEPVPTGKAITVYYGFDR